jgi:hypothetical protein
VHGRFLLRRFIWADRELGSGSGDLQRRYPIRTERIGRGLDRVLLLRAPADREHQDKGTGEDGECLHYKTSS